MARKNKQRKIKRRATTKPKLIRGSRRYSAGEIFMAALGAALIIFFGVMILLGLLE